MSLSLERRPLFLPVIAFAATALVIGLAYKHGASDSSDENSSVSLLGERQDEGANFGIEEEDEVELPPHVRREIYKTERREKLRSWLTMKKPMYDNIAMVDGDDNKLSNISMKKANWYVKKGLADWTDDTKKCIRLNFTPSGHDKHPGQREYNTSTKQNRCVVCGDSETGYARHYIVPYVYRSLLPHRYKSHMPHDIVILCPDCHVTAERHVNLRRNELEETARRKARLSKQSSRPMLIDTKIRAVKRAASTLLHFRQKLPEQRIHHLEAKILDSGWFHEQWAKVGSSSGALLDEPLLRQASNLDDEVINPDYIPGPQLVVDSILDDVEGFVKMWRRHFLELMGPRYLPVSWSVDAPVVSDRRKDSSSAS